MKEYLYFPLEVCREILRRLPFRSIIRCKCVCKSWRHLIQGEWGEFTTSYTPKPGLVFAYSTGHAICDEAFQPLFQLRLPLHDQYSSYDYPRVIIDSVNGLILVRDRFDNSHITLSVLNPITREYVELPPQPARRSVFGFGVSKISGQYKIFCGTLSRLCHVYTLGGREELWRSIPAATALLPWNASPGPSIDHAVFLNGNLHWLASDFEDEKSIFICCFDLETEHFTRFSLPSAHEYDSNIYGVYQLCILDGHLCFFDGASDFNENQTNLLNVIWSMKSYGDSKSYSFYSPIPMMLDSNAEGEKLCDIVVPIKVSNGELVFSMRDQFFICSENVMACGFLPFGHLNNLSNYKLYAPSFLSLKTIGIHNVQLFN